MASHDNFNENASKRNYTAPYSHGHKVPNIQEYRERQGERQDISKATVPEEVADDAPEDEEKEGILGAAKRHLHLDVTVKEEEKEGIVGAAKRHLHLDGAVKDPRVDEERPYRSQNRNIEYPAGQDIKTGNDHQGQDGEGPQHGSNLSKDDGGQDEADQAKRKGKSSILEDTSEAMENTLDPKQKRKNMKHLKRDHATREVTDPVTHLRVTIHDTTNKELEEVPENEPQAGALPRSATGDTAKSKTESQLERESKEQQADHAAMEKLFPPPSFDATREKIAGIYRRAFLLGIGTVATVVLLTLLGIQFFNVTHNEPRTWVKVPISLLILIIFSSLVAGSVIRALQIWMENKIHSIWEDEVWTSAREEERKTADSPVAESTQWLNSVVSSIWPLINPDLFTSLADTLEDVMQASLPKLVRMVSVEDLGQGSEAIRILGIRWLPTGAATKDVSEDGKIKSGKGHRESDRMVPGQGEVDDDEKSDSEGKHRAGEQDDDSKEDEAKEEGEEQNIAEGMEAEEGDFVNVEVGFSYRASKSGKSLKTKAKNAHLFLAFYLPGGIRFPVWVELRGIVGTMRMRLQLCPDPPFFSLCTLTLLGQPKVELSCVPLTRKGLNIMDFPIISSFVQSSIDAALAEYVAPKSLTLDLKDMLVGDDFKKNTTTRGVIMVTIKRGIDFKEGDPGFGPLKKGSSDGYVAVGWAKFGKPVWSTRVITEDMQPVWEETTFIQVGPNEMNAEERLRVQLWDSDRASADDDLGRIEVELKELMHNPKSKCNMWHRTDGFQALEGDEKMPGTLDWSVGYYPKLRIQAEQLEKQKIEMEVRTFQDLKDKVSQEAQKMLREAQARDETIETEQQKAQLLKAKEDEMIASTPPLHDYPTGIFSIQIHQITGLEFEKINKTQAEGDEGDETEAGSGDLPSSYCTIILNHLTIYRTRTKPKSSTPFFNAGTERVVRDWRNSEVMVSVRDSRIHENDALMGIVYLPLGKLLRDRAQVMDSYPVVGGIGYGRVRISMVFRSLELQMPKELLGWDYGTIEITSAITSKDIASDLGSMRLKIHSSINRGKMYTSQTDTAGERRWTGKRDRPVRIAIRKRYSSCLVVEFRKNQIVDKTPAFAVLWLKDIPDEEEVTVTLPVWRGDSNKLKHAQSNCTTEDLGEKAGTINVPLKFYRGLGAYHHKLASKSPNLQDVLEVLSTANDSREVRTAMAGDDDTSSSDSDSSSDSSSSSSSPISKPKQAANGLVKKMAPVEQIKDYKKNEQQLHRRHRGLMQWKVARTGQYLKTKVEHGKDHLLERLGHHEREGGVETEV